MTITIFFAAFAGLFAGLSFGLIYTVRIVREIYRKTDVERMLLLNKAFVRDGQARLFSDEIILGEKPPEKEKHSDGPTTMKTPFQRGIQNAKDKVSKLRFGGSSLPDEVKERIARDAEEAKEAA